MKLIVKDCNTDSLAEEGQQADILFAVCVPRGNNIENITPWIKCRDFFNEMIYVQQSKYPGKMSIFGFSWEYMEELTKVLEETGVAHIAVGMAEKEATTFENNKHLLIQGDMLAGLSPTDIQPIDFEHDEHFSLHYKKYFYLKADKEWLKNSPMFSLYTFYVRLLSNSALNSQGNLLQTLYANAADNKFVSNNYKDGGLLREVVRNPAKFEHFMMNWQNVMKGAPQPMSEDEAYVSALHNGSGIASMMHGIRVSSLDNASVAIKPWVEMFWNAPNFPKGESDVDYGK